MDRELRLIRVYSVCFHDKIKSELLLNICSRCKKQMTYSEQKRVDIEINTPLN